MNTQVLKGRDTVPTSSGSLKVLEAELKEMWRSTGALSGLQDWPPAGSASTENSTRGKVCVRRPACARAPNQDQHDTGVRAQARLCAGALSGVA